jgi:hypothetical protein
MFKLFKHAAQLTFVFLKASMIVFERVLPAADLLQKPTRSVIEGEDVGAGSTSAESSESTSDSVSSTDLTTDTTRFPRDRDAF